MEEKQEKEKGVAHIPSTILTVEYIDKGESMDAALKSLQERLGRFEEQLGSLQTAQQELISVMNQQAREIQGFIESINRRVDSLYRKVSAGRATPAVSSDNVEHEEPAEETPAQVPPTDDPESENAWRIACVMVDDLEAYHPDKVREGVLYDNFYEVLEQPIEQARNTYQERVPPRVLEQFDFFALALEDLIARKREELAQEELPEGQ